MTAVELYAEQAGPPDAPAVLLLGSLGSTLGMWAPQVPALAEGFRTVRCDARGHGRSPAPEAPYSLDDLVDDVVALLDRLGIERAHVVGLSLGGMTGLRLAAREPARVRSLTVLCSSVLFDPGTVWAERAELVRAQGTETIADMIVTRWLTGAHQAADPVLLAALRAMVAGASDTGYAACCDVLQELDLRDDLAAVSAPTLVIGGADDPATPPEHQRRIAAGIAGAQLLVLDDAAHLANLDQPAAVNAALLTHLHAVDAPAARGRAVRRQVLGDAHVDQMEAAATSFTEPFQGFITRTAWGEVWTRPGLDVRTRSMLTLALLTALGHEHELALHVRAALTLGVTADEIGEVLLHSGVYAGVPAANRAFAVAQSVLAEPAEQAPG